MLSSVGPEGVGWQDNHDRTCHMHNDHITSTYSFLHRNYFVAALYNSELTTILTLQTVARLKMMFDKFLLRERKAEVTDVMSVLWIQWVHAHLKPCVFTLQEEKRMKSFTLLWLLKFGVQLQNSKGPSKQWIYKSIDNSILISVPAAYI